MNIYVVLGLLAAAVTAALILKSTLLDKKIQTLSLKKETDQTALTKLQAQEPELKAQAESQQDNATQAQKDAFWTNEEKK
jgi:hypothetical protein